jgi:putative aminopeptidase FrvX
MLRASRSGVPTVVIAIPARRTGSPRLLLHGKDLAQTAMLIQGVLTTPWRA